jgi:hypothetical protein
MRIQKEMAGILTNTKILGLERRKVAAEKQRVGPWLEEKRERLKEL